MFGDQRTRECATRAEVSACNYREHRNLLTDRGSVAGTMNRPLRATREAVADIIPGTVPDKGLRPRNVSEVAADTYEPGRRG
jgi:hypothetical protein